MSKESKAQKPKNESIQIDGKSQKSKNESVTIDVKSQKTKNEPIPISGQTAIANNSPQFRLALFDHLERKKRDLDPNSIEGDSKTVFIHPATVKLGLLYRKGIIFDDDDRAAAMIAAFCNIIQDYSTPPNCQMGRDLDKHIKNQVQHLVDSRQHSMGMGNIIKYVYHSIPSLCREGSEAESKSALIRQLFAFTEERIVLARESIANHCCSVIKPGDTVITFGSSTTVRKVLLSIAKLIPFQLIVIDTRPLNEGLATLHAMSEVVKCTYTPLSGAAAVMKKASRVILGASSLLSNGSMIAPAGTAMIAALAKMKRIPVIVAAETYKFCEKVQLDSIVFNELGSQFEIVKENIEEGLDSKFLPEFSPVYKGTAGNISEKAPAFQVINLRSFYIIYILIF